MTLPAVSSSRGREIRRAVHVPRAAYPALVLFVTLVGMASDDAGYSSGAWAAASIALLWVTALALLLGVRLELAARERYWLALLAALIAWTALSATWSVNGNESLLEIRRDMVYLAGAGTLLLLATRRSVEDLVTAVWAGVTLVVVYALVVYLFVPRLRAQDVEGNLLFRPLGYANAVGIFAGLAATLAVGLSVRASSSFMRPLAAASIAPLAAAVYLASSRGSALAIVVGLAAMLLIDRDRFQLVRALLVLGPAALIIVALSARSRLPDPASGALVWQGRLLALWIALGALALAFALPAVDRAGRGLRRSPRFWWGLAGGACVAALVVGAVLHGRAEHGLVTGYRPAYWHVAWREYAAHPWLGSGAGTFGDYWTRYGDVTVQAGALDAHNLYLETLAELGPVGLALLVPALAFPLLAAVGVRRHPLVSAAGGAYVAFLAHAALDWDWELPVVTLAAVGCAVAIMVAGRTDDERNVLSPRMRVGALVVTLGLASFALVAQLAPGLGGTFP